MDKKRERERGNGPVTGIYKSDSRLLRLLLFYLHHFPSLHSLSFSSLTYSFLLFPFSLPPSPCKTFLLLLLLFTLLLVSRILATRRVLNSWIPDIFIWTSVGYFYATRIPDPFSRLFAYIYIYISLSFDSRYTSLGGKPEKEYRWFHRSKSIRNTDVYRLDVYREWFMQPRVVKLIWICLQRIIIVFSCTRDIHDVPRVLRETPFDNLSRGKRILFV